VATPPLLMVFDLLYRAGRDQTKRPLRDRRARLEEIVADAERIFQVRRLTSNGLVAWGEVLQAGFEGYVGRTRRRVRERPHDALAEGQAEGLDRRGGRLAADELGAGSLIVAAPPLANAAVLHYAPGRDPADRA
jgi:ATP dependent DNA ligase domain